MSYSAEHFRPFYRFQSFHSILDWLMQQGVRPDNEYGRPWSNDELGNAMGVSPDLVDAWRNGTDVPNQIQRLSDLFFGTSNDGERGAAKKYLDDQWQRVAGSPFDDDASINPIADHSLQTYVVTTPLEGQRLLVSLSINTKEIHNILGEIESLLPQKLNGTRFANARSVNDFIKHLAGDGLPYGPPPTSNDIEQIYFAIDERYVFLIEGSIKGGKIADLQKVPMILKAFAGMKIRDYCVGLFRVGTFLFVMGMFVGTGGGVGLAAGKTLWDLGNQALSALITKTDK